MAKTVLVVDDAASVRQLLKFVLSEAGYQIVEAGDGEEGLARLGAERVHLIISDINMPKLDGIGFVKRVKLLPDYRFTPIIMLTTESQEGKKREAQAAGAKAWIVKPFTPEGLLGAVRKLVAP